MATENLTVDDKERKFEEEFCSTALTGRMHDQLTGLLVFNIFVSVFTLLGNTVILIALYKESSIHPPSKLLLRCLATTDLGIGIVSEPLCIIYWMSAINESWNICRFAFLSLVITGNALCGMSLLTLTAISVDRLLALSLGLRYKQVVTLKRMYVIVTIFWVTSAGCSIMYLKNYLVTVRYSHIFITLCLGTAILSYTKIFLNLRQRQSQGHDVEQPRQSSQLNIARYRKAVSTALWLQLTLVACYLPNGVVIILVTEGSLSPSLVLINQITLTLVFLNSSLNPILYCWKISYVRQAVKRTTRKLCCLSS